MPGSNVTISSRAMSSAHLMIWDDPSDWDPLFTALDGAGGTGATVLPFLLVAFGIADIAAAFCACFDGFDAVTAGWADFTAGLGFFEPVRTNLRAVRRSEVFFACFDPLDA